MTSYSDIVSIAATSSGVAGTVTVTKGAHLKALNLAWTQNAAAALPQIVEITFAGAPTPLRFVIPALSMVAGTPVGGSASMGQMGYQLPLDIKVTDATVVTLTLTSSGNLTVKCGLEFDDAGGADKKGLQGDYASISATSSGVSGTLTTVPNGIALMGLNVSMATADGGVISSIEITGAGIQQPLKLVFPHCFGSITTNMYAMAVGRTPTIDLQRFNIKANNNSITVKVTTTANETVIVGLMWMV